MSPLPALRIPMGAMTVAAANLFGSTLPALVQTGSA